MKKKFLGVKGLSLLLGAMLVFSSCMTPIGKEAACRNLV